MGTFDKFMRSSAGGADGKVSGITTAVVKENWNADFPGKVKLEMSMGASGKNVTGWARVMSPYAGESFGMYMLPEVGSEVVVAFDMGDRNCPVVLGSLWNDKNKLPEGAAAEKNPTKVIMTKGGSVIKISDEDKKQQIDIMTPGKLNILMDDENKTVTVQDADKKNMLVINGKEGSVTLSADKKLILEVGGAAALTLDGSGKSAELKMNNITVDAAQALKLKGNQGTFEGTTVAINSNGKLDISSKAVTAIKGTACVQIN